MKRLTHVKDMRNHCGEYPHMSVAHRALPFLTMVNLHSPPPPHGRHRHARRLWGTALALGLASFGAFAQQGAPDVARQKELVRMVRQDCGSCHGLYLTGGLGPALTREALADKPLDSMAATIYGGRPGTPMAPWKAMLTEAEALWIAQQLMAGFPEPQKDPR